MYTSKNEIEKIVDDFCEEHHCHREMFEVSEISYNATGGKTGRLYNRTKVINCDCTYVIKYYQKLDIIVIWNYSVSPNMSYNYNTIKQKLAAKLRCGDKGTGFHGKKQSYVFFDKGSELYQLLILITNPI
ncbi:MAG: hypothetical protein LUC30_02100 [Clostridiales bacterium]|nr:hypothetical protein [Clostridiales bacterium]